MAVCLTAAAVFAVAPKQAPAPLTVNTPLDYQVIQRHALNEGTIAIRGGVTVACDKVEVKLEGKDMNGTPLPATWKAAELDAAAKTFTAKLTVPAGGWYKLVVRAEITNSKTAIIKVVEHVGVGEIFVGAGQSNSTSCGGLGSNLPTDGRTQPTSGMVSSFNGASWRIANDPQPGAQDQAIYHNGSFWPAFGDAMVAKFKVPVGVAVTGYGGTGINQWEVGGKLFNGTLLRMNQLGTNGFRAVLWHQGESDYGAKAEAYADGLGKIITGIRKEAGWEMPWCVAHASFCPGKPVVDTNSRGGQKILWGKGIALEGPDTDKMLGDLRDQCGKASTSARTGSRFTGKPGQTKSASGSTSSSSSAPQQKSPNPP